MFTTMLRAIRFQIKRLLLDSRARRHIYVGGTEDWQVVRDMQIQLLKGHGLLQQHVLLDMGCGTLRGGIPIIEYLEPGHYHGFEPRAKVLTEGRKEVSEAGLEGKSPRLYQAEQIANAGIEQRFDYIWCFSVLFHMTDERVSEALAFAKAHLNAHGQSLASANIGQQPSQAWQEFPVNWRSFAFYESLGRKAGLHM